MTDVLEVHASAIAAARNAVHSGQADAKDLALDSLARELEGIEEAASRLWIAPAHMFATEIHRRALAAREAYYDLRDRDAVDLEIRAWRELADELVYIANKQDHDLARLYSNEPYRVAEIAKLRTVVEKLRKTTCSQT